MEAIETNKSNLFNRMIACKAEGIVSAASGLAVKQRGPKASATSWFALGFILHQLKKSC